MTDVPETKKCAMKHLAPIIEERLKLREESANDQPVCSLFLVIVLLRTITFIERSVNMDIGRSTRGPGAYGQAADDPRVGRQLCCNSRRCLPLLSVLIVLWLIDTCGRLLQTYVTVL